MLYKPLCIYELTIQLHDNENYTAQASNITKLLREYYFSRNMTMWCTYLEQDEPGVLQTKVYETDLDTIVSLIKQEGYEVTYEKMDWFIQIGTPVESQMNNIIDNTWY